MSLTLGAREKDKVKIYLHHPFSATFSLIPSLCSFSLSIAHALSLSLSLSSLSLSLSLNRLFISPSHTQRGPVILQLKGVTSDFHNPSTTRCVAFPSLLSLFSLRVVSRRRGKRGGRGRRERERRERGGGGMRGFQARR
jgi:hypothetical protein